MIKRDAVTEALLDAVKNYLNITWTDKATDERICGFIAAGTVYLDSKGGGELAYEADGLPRTLLMEYVRYANSEALDVFEVNYTSMILAMQTERLVDAYAKAESGA